MGRDGLMADAVDNKDPRKAPPKRVGMRQASPEPAKDQRAMLTDMADRFQSGAALRNRYEDGEFLPGRGTPGKASDRNR